MFVLRHRPSGFYYMQVPNYSPGAWINALDKAHPFACEPDAWAIAAIVCADPTMTDVEIVPLAKREAVPA